MEKQFTFIETPRRSTGPNDASTAGKVAWCNDEKATNEENKGYKETDIGTLTTNLGNLNTVPQFFFFATVFTVSPGHLLNCKKWNEHLNQQAILSQPAIVALVTGRVEI